MIATRSFAPGKDFSLSNFTRYYLMRLVPFEKPRRAIASVMARRVNAQHPANRKSTDRVELDPVAQDALRTLQARGCAIMAPQFSDEQLAEIDAYLKDKPVLCKGKLIPRSDVPEAVARAPYSLADVLACPHVVDAMNRPEILEFAAQYLGCRATISAIGLHWSIPTAEGCDVQRFHRDPDDWRFLKVFCYLNDVDALNGPHEYVATSHATSGRFRSKPYSDEEVAERFGKENILSIKGPRGTTFCADTWGIHRGGVPLKHRRLMLQVTYSILPIAKFVYEPQSPLPHDSIDPYTNRLLLS